jgi:spore coat polysaccharide biosynthesis protein SpsF
MAGVLGIVQARMASTRLPGKTLKIIEGKPMLGHILERIGRSERMDEIVVATTTGPEDDVLCSYVQGEAGRPVFRGSPEDVLDRFYRCAMEFDARVVVRVTADDPLKDPRIIDECVSLLGSEPALDYCSNTLHPTYPEGLDIEVFSFRALERAFNEARLDSEREHVTPYIWKNNDRFRVREMTYTRDLSSWRLTVDNARDFQLMEAIFRFFSQRGIGNRFTFADVVSLLEEKPELRAINQGTARNEGYLRSVTEESR